MRSKSGPQPSAEQHVREIRRQTRKLYSSEEKIRIARSLRSSRLAGLSSKMKSGWNEGNTRPGTGSRLLMIFSATARLKVITRSACLASNVSHRVVHAVASPGCGTAS